MPITYRRSGEEFVVHSYGEDDQDQQSITALASGGFVVTWLSYIVHPEYGGDSIPEVRAQIYSPNGVAVGEEITLSASPNSTGLPAIASLDTGGFVATWYGTDLGFGLHGRVFHADGTPSGNVFKVNTTDGHYQTRSSITSLPTGGFVVTWMDGVSSDSGFVFDIRAQVFNPNGTKVGGEIVVDATPHGARPTIATLKSGEFVITWYENSDNPDTDGIKAQRFSASGAKLGGEFLVNTSLEGAQRLPDIAALPTGGFVVTWFDEGAPGSGLGAIVGQRFDSLGRKVGGEFTVEDAGALVGKPIIATLPSGGFVVSWLSSDAEGPLKLQVYNADGTRSGGIAEFGSGAVRAPTIAVLPSGKVVVSWTDVAWSEDGFSVKAQILTPINEIRGTVNNDSTVGTAGDDYVLGLGGDDQLNGGAGDDVLDGGAGADRMTGAAGNDSYIVNEAGDIIVEVAGGGVDSVSASVSFTLANHVENLTLTGLALNGSGNALGNVITGNARANVLNGGSGADTMKGGAGNDVYVVDNRSDQVVELDGAGTDRVESVISFRLGEGIEDLTLTGLAMISGTGNALANRITGNNAANILNGGAGNDVLKGGGGDDTYFVDSSGDLITETLGAGNDLVKAGADFVLGNHVEALTLTGIATSGTGNTLANDIVGNARANILRGEAGADAIDGGLGGDKLYGGTGNDELVGGAGVDRFYFDTALSRTVNVDQILDLSVADDLIYLDRRIFTAIATDGRLQADAFHVGAAAADAEDRIVYNSETGRLFYDADGSGVGKAVLFAQLDTGLALTNADIIAYLPVM